MKITRSCAVSGKWSQVCTRKLLMSWDRVVSSQRLGVVGAYCASTGAVHTTRIVLSVSTVATTEMSMTFNAKVWS